MTRKKLLVQRISSIGITTVMLLALGACDDTGYSDGHWSRRIVPPPSVDTLRCGDCYTDLIAAEARMDLHHVDAIWAVLNEAEGDVDTSLHAIMVLSRLAEVHPRDEYLKLALHADRIAGRRFGDLLAALSANYRVPVAEEVIRSITVDNERALFERVAALRILVELCQADGQVVTSREYRGIVMDESQSPVLRAHALLAVLVCIGPDDELCHDTRPTIVADLEATPGDYVSLIEEMSSHCAAMQ